MLLFASCGQQHQAKNVIETFIYENINEPSAVNGLKISKFDSTRVVNDSVIKRMRQHADTIQRFSKHIKYADMTAVRKLFVARVTYSFYGVECSDTYYLDDQLSSVVAFKSN